MNILILGKSGSDCAAFAAQHGITQFYWLSLNRRVDKLENVRVNVIYATPLIRAEWQEYDALVDVAEELRA